jgi:hypothetical protein
MAIIGTRVLAIIDVALQVNLLGEYLIENKIQNISLICNETVRIKGHLLRCASTISKYQNRLSKTILSLRVITGRYSKIIIGSELGLVNSMIILASNANLVILDDGNLSLYRKQKKFLFFLNFRKIYKKKSIEYYSIFPPVFKKQPGTFNVKLFSRVKNEESYQNKFFYISGANWLDGMSQVEELSLYRALDAYAISAGFELIILPHRKDKFDEYKNFLYKEYVLNTGKNFEEWYLSSNFTNCIFATINSTAIYSVGQEHPRFYIKPNYKIAMFKSKMEKVFFFKTRDVEVIWSFYEKCGIRPLIII